jgi:hemolysin activation/secretion protein
MMLIPKFMIGAGLARSASAAVRRRVVRGFALTLPMVLVATLAAAQAIPPNLGAGREREQFMEPTQPRARPGGVAISLPSTTAPPEAKTVQVLISRIRIVGSTVYGDEEWAPLVAELLGRRVPLQAVYDLAQKITAKYGADGYVLSRAIVPVQELEPRGAVVRIEIIEGYIDKVVWPERVARYRDFFTEYAAKIVADRPTNLRTLERYLLLANDLPGLRFSTTLRASETKRGASTLIVELTEKPVDLFARFDNRGTEARGPLQFLVTATINNLMRQHESLALTYAAALPVRELQFISANYRHVLNSEGLTAFAYGSFSWSRPGTAALEELDFRTRSTYGELGASYPIIRARERNVTIVALAFAGENYNLFNLTTDPQAVDRLRGARVRLEGDFADKTGAINQFNVMVSQGITGLGSTTNDNPLASRLGGRVDFTKVEAFASRLQPLGNRFSLFLAGFGQYAFTPLLVPEQCGFGGRVFGRAFDPSELLGDHCIMGTAELRYDLPNPLEGMLPKGEFNPVPSMQLFGFADKANLYRLPVAAVGTEAATFVAASAGSGIRFGWADRLNVDLTGAKAIEGPRNDWRFFFITSARL